jgi:hypothetical protein
MQDSPTPAPRWILHPALFAAAFVLEVALSNKIEPAGFARALAVAVLAGVCLTLLGWALARDRWIGGLIASSVVLLSVSFLPIFFAWQALGPTVALLLMALLVFALVAVPVVARRRVRRGAPVIRWWATSALNLFAAVLVAVGVAVHAGPDMPGAIADALRPPLKVPVAPIEELPDIYVILLDGYPRADVLERKFGVDNSEFLDGLTALGFDVGADSHSNYIFTQLTMASMFQMRHLDEIDALSPLVGVRGGHANELRNTLIDSPGFAALDAAGYQVIVTQPGYEHVALRGVADRVLEHGEMNDLERDVLKRTWLLSPLGALIPTLYTGPPRDRVVHAFDDLSRLGSEERGAPRFTWIHVPAPHLPLVLDAEGRPLELDPVLFDKTDAEGYGMTDAEFAAAYAAELSYLNRRVLGAVRDLTRLPGRPDPVIVVLSDHGYATDLSDPQAQLANLFAAHTPQAPGLLADAPTPVNLMSILLNRFLGTDFPIQPDRYFLSPSIHDLMMLVEIHRPS